MRETYDLEIPLPTWGLNAERSMHWAEHGRRTKEFKGLTSTIARNAKIPKLTRVAIYAWPVGKSMRQDVASCFPSVKAAIDGLVLAKVLTNDTPRIVTRLTLLPPRTGRYSALVMRIVDVSDEDD